MIIILGFPFYVYGLINNYLTYFIPGRIAKIISNSIEYRGAISMVGGMFTFLIFYSIQIVLVWKLTDLKLLTLVYAISLPLSGIYAYWYYHTVKKIGTKWLLIMLFYKKSVFISSLISERDKIIEEFDTFKNEYIEIINKKNI